MQTGLSESFVFVLSAREGKSVLKLQIDPTEHDFYLKFAPEKLRRARWLPKVLDSGWNDEWNWLQLEFIPNPWPASKWNVDPHALHVLRTLHETPVAHEEFEWVDCSWMPSDLAFCEDVLPSKTIDQLVRFQEAHLGLAGRDPVLCSGDPYPLNWLERSDGGLVKIDWQGLALEHRAFDLAGWISTIIPYSEIERIARLYLGLGVSAPADDQIVSLTRAIVVFYVRRCACIFKRAGESSHPDRWQAGVETITKQLPLWLTTVDHVL